MQAEREQPKILVVDDDLSYAGLLSGILGRGDFELETAHDGESAVEKVKTFKPDAILLDIVMPGMDGYEVTKRLKGAWETSVIPIILMTGVGDASDKVKGLEAGADEFIIKPVDRIELLARVRFLVKLKKLQDRMRSTEERVDRPSSAAATASGNGKNTILIVEDDVKTANVYELLLRSKGFKTLIAHDGGDAIAIVEKDLPDLVLLDLMLPGMDGLEILARLKASPLLMKIPVIICSIIPHSETRVKAIDTGADDYLIKPVNHREMLARINAAIRRSGAWKKLRSENDCLFEQSVLDPLTGLYNRRYLKTVIESDIAAAKRHGRGFFLVMLDIDDFKNINDTFGHNAGDVVLKELGHLLRMKLRTCDIAVRYGGEEFVVC